LNQILGRRSFGVKILLETTAGQGTNLGYKFEQLAGIRRLVKKKSKIGFCLDTAHIFAAGYDLRTKSVYDKTISEFDKILGLKNLFVIHINDSKKDLGSRVDRHEHIGKGFLGKDVFRFFLNDKRLISIPKILETPKDGRQNDLKVLRKLEKI
jgi:deoxyribonuclease-4